MRHQKLKLPSKLNLTHWGRNCFSNIKLYCRRKKIEEKKIDSCEPVVGWLQKQYNIMILSKYCNNLLLSIKIVACTLLKLTKGAWLCISIQKIELQIGRFSIAGKPCYAALGSYQLLVLSWVGLWNPIIASAKDFR